MLSSMSWMPTNYSRTQHAMGKLVQWVNALSDINI